jgi:hypothetical protein
MPCRRGGQHVGLDAAHQDRVRRLLGHEALQAAVAGGPLRLDDLAGGVGGRPDVAGLALPDQVGQRAEGVLDVGVLAGPVHLVKVDVVGVQAAQRVLDLADDPAPGAAPLVRVAAVHGHEEFRGQHDAVPPPGQGPANDPLGLAPGVDVGGVDEVDARVERAVDDADRVGLVLVSHGPNIIAPAAGGPARTLVGLTWNADDVAGVLTLRAMISLCVIDRAHVRPGTEATVIWGRPGTQQRGDPAPPSPHCRSSPTTDG